MSDEAGERAERLSEIRSRLVSATGRWEPGSMYDACEFLLSELDRVMEKVQRYEYTTCAIHRHPVCSDCTAQTARERDTAFADLKRAEGARDEALEQQRHAEEDARQCEADLRRVKAERDEFKHLGHQFERDSRNFFEQSCKNLERAQRAEASNLKGATGNVLVRHVRAQQQLREELAAPSPARTRAMRTAEFIHPKSNAAWPPASGVRPWSSAGASWTRNRSTSDTYSSAN